ncbi:hypothetical protein ACX0GZ_05300 [Sphingomonas aestuarii]
MKYLKFRDRLIVCYDAKRDNLSHLRLFVAMTATVPKESTRRWLAGLAITLTTVIALFGFWRLSPGLTFLIACVALVGLIISFWIAGKDG